MSEQLDEQFRMRAIQLITVCLIDLAWAFHCHGQSMLKGDLDEDERADMFKKIASDITDQKPKDVAVTVH